MSMRSRSFFYTNAAFFVSCSFFLLYRYPLLIFLEVFLFLFLNLVPGFFEKGIADGKLRLLTHGAHCLMAFWVTAILGLLYHIVLAVFVIAAHPFLFLFSVLLYLVSELLLYLNGILSVFVSSRQMGIKRRLAYAWLGVIPLVNIPALSGTVAITFEEARLENAKAKLNLSRREERVCETRYPILMIHGVFFRDSPHLSYWGRIPNELITNGAKVYYGNHQSALSVEASAKELAARIRAIVEETVCEKVNVIAHSKGGLDIRYALAYEGVSPLVASVTTINTPHRGCVFAEYLLDRAPETLRTTLAKAYNKAARVIGDTEPDFLAALNDLKATVCIERDRALEPPTGVFCQSVGSSLENHKGGRFPLNYSYLLVKLFDGKNDGLVSESSFEWGEKYTFLKPKGGRGISHGDMIDLMRENLPDFDVREFYVQLVADLKNRGL